MYSFYALKGLISTKDYNCWALFVKACQLLCTQTITVDQINDSDLYLKTFCEQCALIYGRQTCTININMHLHLHLHESLLNFGPVYSFWCYSFERYNMANLVNYIETTTASQFS